MEGRQTFMFHGTVLCAVERHASAFGIINNFKIAQLRDMKIYSTQKIHISLGRHKFSRLNKASCYKFSTVVESKYVMLTY